MRQWVLDHLLGVLPHMAQEEAREVLIASTRGPTGAYASSTTTCT
jgi:hypothetical protein